MISREQRLETIHTATMDAAVAAAAVGAAHTCHTARQQFN